MAGLSRNIRPPKFEEDFSWWKKRMEVYFETDFDFMLTIENGFDLPRDNKGREHKKKKWSKEQLHDYSVNIKVK